MEQCRVNERTSLEAWFNVVETALHRARSEESFRRVRISTTSGDGRFSIEGVEFAPREMMTGVLCLRVFCVAF